jgi:hypothetical protein
MMRLWSWTDDADAEPPVEAPSEGLHNRYFVNRKLRRWKAFKPKDKPAN